MFHLSRIRTKANILSSKYIPKRIFPRELILIESKSAANKNKPFFMKKLEGYSGWSIQRLFSVSLFSSTSPHFLNLIVFQSAPNLIFSSISLLKTN